MRLVEAIIDANHRALAGDPDAGLHPAEYQNELPLVALTCIDPRLNALLPSCLGVPPEQFIWLRNAGNIITGPTSSTMRSLALALGVKGGKEIVIIGHTDCQVGKTSTMQLIDRFRAMGVERHVLPDNINDFFGIFSSPHQNVIKAAQIARSSPLIGPKVCVHGLLVDIQTGKLEWLVNGYQTLETMGARWNEAVKSAEQTLDALKPLANFNLGEIKFPETKIGESVVKAEDWLAQKVHQLEIKPPAQTPPAPRRPTPPPAPPKIPMPPPLRPKVHLRRGLK
jgi:carbonic anhydrase